MTYIPLVLPASLPASAATDPVVRLRILSDLHLESAPWTFTPAGEDLVILAGDVCDHSSVGLRRRDSLFTQIERAGLQALYVLGNHEGYQAQAQRRELTTRIQHDLPDHVTLLDQQVVVERHGLRFVGCPLWTDFNFVEDIRWRGVAMNPEQAAFVASRCVKDFDHWLPDGGGRPLQPDDIIAWHREERAWLTECVEAVGRPLVVVTHFLPGPGSVAEQYRTHPATPYFVSDCRELTRPPVRLWIHGHTHTSCRYRHSAVEVVCNPRGYGNENRDFQADLVVEVSYVP